LCPEIRKPEVFFGKGLPENLPNFCSRENIFLIMLDNKQTCPLPELLRKAVYSANFLKRV
jgi:hypothetical protein